MVLRRSVRLRSTSWLRSRRVDDGSTLRGGGSERHKAPEQGQRNSLVDVNHRRSSFKGRTSIGQREKEGGSLVQPLFSEDSSCLPALRAANLQRQNSVRCTSRGKDPLQLFRRTPTRPSSLPPTSCRGSPPEPDRPCPSPSPPSTWHRRCPVLLDWRRRSGRCTE